MTKGLSASPLYSMRPYVYMLFRTLLKLYAKYKALVAWEPF